MKSGQADNTIAVFSADNGAEAYAYERDKKYGHWSSGPFRGLKQDIYEGGHHVPFVIRWPGVIMLGKELPLTGPHRHYSHLVGLYPLRRIDADNAEEHALYLRTVDHWLGFKTKHPLTRHSWGYKGYTRTGATPMYAMLDEPEKALDQFLQYFDLRAEGGYTPSVRFV